MKLGSVMGFIPQEILDQIDHSKTVEKEDCIVTRDEAGHTITYEVAYSGDWSLNSYNKDGNEVWSHSFWANRYDWYRIAYNANGFLLGITRSSDLQTSPEELYKQKQRKLFSKLGDILNIAKENTQQLLQEHDAALGRTTPKNKSLALMYEKEVVDIEEALCEIKKSSGENYES